MAWLINNIPPADLGITIAGGEWRSGAASTVRLSCGADADAPEIFLYNTEVVITYDGATFFRGHCRRLDQSASGSAEGHDYVIEDAWAELERTTYQEEWAYGASSTVLLPEVVLGVDKYGTRITLAQQITEAITFAANAGVSIQPGSVPSGGMELWPTEATGMSCAEVIRTCLRFHPDWIPWINHATTPPTLNIVKADEAPARPLPLTSLSDVRITNRNDRIPECVRLLFMSATDIDGEVYRDGTVQKFPLSGPDSGPGVLTTIIELGGGKASVAKQQIETRPLPHPGLATRDEAKDWLKAHFPTLADIPNTHMGITKWEASLVADANPKPDPINPHAERMALREDHLADDAPRELIEGTVQEWMRKRVGKVRIDLTLVDGPLATAAERVIIRKIPKTLVVTGTNALTKIYKGRPQWKTYAEQAPTGVAQAYYETILAGCRYEGSVTLPAEGMELGSWVGYVVNITGATSAWSAMNAPVHSAAWDIANRRVTVSFGPNPDLSPQDYMDYLRLLRDRPATWISPEERTSPRLGDEGGPSRKGDHVGPGPGPKETAIPSDDTQPPFWVEIVLEDAEDPEDPPVPKWTVTRGRVFERQRATSALNMIYHEPDNILTEAGVPSRFEVTAGHAIYVKVTELIPSGVISGVTIDTEVSTKQAEETAGTSVVFYYKLAEAIETDGEWSLTPFLMGSHIYHWPEQKGLDLKVWDWSEDTDNRIVIGSIRETHYFRKGGYVGTASPGTATDATANVLGK